ncbi:hypothetical protein AC138_15545 [Pseudomonas putida]|nr:hypothetical protein AC138_15545 [Pseudomonas putida]KMY34556.1 hypothetical protein AA993_11620 [Pseudomonas putida]PXZ51576.1 hypothetical protein DM483_07170 [Pseudomonas sp. SMT-1]
MVLSNETDSLTRHSRFLGGIRGRARALWETTSRVADPQLDSLAMPSEMTLRDILRNDYLMMITKRFPL